MDVITKDVRALAKKELAAANRRFRMFASPHEGYAVIREELDELIDEVRKLHFGLTIRLWRDVKRNEPMKREHLNLIYDVANPRSGGSYSAGRNGQEIRTQPAARLAGRQGAGLWNGA